MFSRDSNWHMFVNCINQFVMSGYTRDQRSAFKGAVQTAVKSVHRMCSDPSYKTGQGTEPTLTFFIYFLFIHTLTNREYPTYR